MKHNRAMDYLDEVIKEKQQAMANLESEISGQKTRLAGLEKQQEEIAVQLKELYATMAVLEKDELNEKTEQARKSA